MSIQSSPTPQEGKHVPRFGDFTSVKGSPGIGRIGGRGRRLPVGACLVRTPATGPGDPHEFGRHESVGDDCDGPKGRHHGRQALVPSVGVESSRVIVGKLRATMLTYRGWFPSPAHGETHHHGRY